METITPNNIKKTLVSDGDRKIIDDQIKKAKNKASAVHYTDEEAKAIMEGKLQERLKRQKEFRRVYLGRIYRQVEIDEILQQLKSENITVQWRGIPMPKNLLMIEYNILMNEYSELITKENQLRQSLVNDDLTDEQITEIQEGNYVKDIPKTKTKTD